MKEIHADGFLESFNCELFDACVTCLKDQNFVHRPILNEQLIYWKSYMMIYVVHYFSCVQWILLLHIFFIDDICVYRFDEEKSMKPLKYLKGFYNEVENHRNKKNQEFMI